MPQNIFDQIIAEGRKNVFDEVAPKPKTSAQTFLEIAFDPKVNPWMNRLIGMGKSIGEVGTGVVNWASDLDRQLQDVVTGKQNPFLSTNQNMNSPTQLFAPTTSTGADPFAATNEQQQAGKFYGNVGMGMGAAAATAGASLPGQVAGMGLAGAALSPEHPYIGAGLSMAAPTAQAIMATKVPGIEKSAQEWMSSAINPHGFAEKTALSKVLPEITKDKPFAWSSEKLLNIFVQRADKASRAIDDLVDSVTQGGKFVDLKKTAAYVDDAIDALKTPVAPGVNKIITPEFQAAAQQLGTIKAEIMALERAPRTREGMLAAVRSLKQQYDAIVKTGEAQNLWRELGVGSRPAAAFEGRMALQKGMADTAPEFATAGKEAQKQITAANILAKNELRNLSGTQSRIGTVAETGMALYGSIPQALAMRGALKFMDSTPFKLAAANLQTALADAIRSGNAQAATQLMAQMTRAQTANDDQRESLIRALREYQQRQGGR